MECRRECLVEWSEWSEWSRCTNKCAPGTRTRSRGCLVDDVLRVLAYCDRFIPDDVIRDVEVEECNVGICRTWSEWIVSKCTAQSCGQVGVQRRHRVCQTTTDKLASQSLFDRTCYSDVIKCEGRCKPVLGVWSSWSACSQRCGEGEKVRGRECLQRGRRVDASVCVNDVGYMTMGEVEERVVCNRGACSMWGEWKVVGECSSRCNGTRTVMRRCDGVSVTSSGLDRECTRRKEECGSSECSVSFGEWGHWGQCSRRCGRGLRRRYRRCMSSMGGDKMSTPFRMCAHLGKPVERESCIGVRC